MSLAPWPCTFSGTTNLIWQVSNKAPGASLAVYLFFLSIAPLPRPRNILSGELGVGRRGKM